MIVEVGCYNMVQRRIMADKIDHGIHGRHGKFLK